MLHFSSNMEKLVDLLKNIENNSDIPDHGHDVIPASYPEVKDAGYLAESVLISSSGRVDWDTVEILREYGYYVFPLERDRFGWLIGGIATTKGTISFG